MLLSPNGAIHLGPKGPSFLASADKKLKEQDYIISREVLNGHEVIHYDLCNKCKHYWPIFEVFYWSVYKSGLDLELFETLDRRIQKDNKAD